MTLQRLYYFNALIGILVLPIIMLTFYNQYCYFTSNFKEENFTVEKCEFSETPKPDDSPIIAYGKVNNKYATIFVGDGYETLFYNHYEKYNKNAELNFEDFRDWNLKIRVFQFGNSNTVFIIKKNQTLEDAAYSNLEACLLTEFFIYVPLIILYFLNRKDEKKN
jgi:hypothetical protein